MSEDLVAWLEEEGWDVLPQPSEGQATQEQITIEARRQRGERVETAYAGPDGRLRYTAMRPVGEEEFRRVGEGDRALRVVSRTYAETTVTCEVGPDGTRAELERAVAAARG